MQYITRYFNIQPLRNLGIVGLRVPTAKCTVISQWQIALAGFKGNAIGLFVNLFMALTRARGIKRVNDNNNKKKKESFYVSEHYFAEILGFFFCPALFLEYYQGWQIDLSFCIAMEWISNKMAVIFVLFFFFEKNK